MFVNNLWILDKP